MTDELTALRARVAELEGGMRTCRDLFVEIQDDWYDADWACPKGLEVIETALSATPTPDPRDARIAELEAALRGMVSAFESSGNEWGEKLEYEDSALAAARRALGDAHG